MRLMIYVSQGVFHVAGDLDQDSTFEEIEDYYMDPVIMDLTGLRRIDALGSKRWIEILEMLQERKIFLRNCPQVVIEQINMFPEFLVHAQIRSFSMPFYCESCQTEQSFKATMKEAKKENFLSTINDRYECEDCEALVQLKPNVDEYFEFLAPYLKPEETS